MSHLDEFVIEIIRINKSNLSEYEKQKKVIDLMSENVDNLLISAECLLYFINDENKTRH